jgi:hypothetical protein
MHVAKMTCFAFQPVKQKLEIGPLGRSGAQGRCRLINLPRSRSICTGTSAFTAIRGSGADGVSG